MKKIYNNPSTRVVKIRSTHHLMQASGTGMKGTASSGREVLSRENSWWDDEEE